MPEERKLYTLFQARQKLAELDCDKQGCSIQVYMTNRGYDGVIKYRAYACTRCNKEYIPKS